MDIQIRINKNGGICDIVDAETGVRNDAMKRALNMFAGRQLASAESECIEYTKACIEGDEATIQKFHYKWNGIMEGIDYGWN